MVARFFLSIFAAFVFFSIPSVLAFRYSDRDSYVGRGFYSGFVHEAIPDPTNGRVRYVDEKTSRARNLTFATDSTFIIRADAKTKLSASGPGRSSVRLKSRKTYGHETVMLANIRHMPTGCGTWPALWGFGSPWPTRGEIDVLEGVNGQGPNHATLHTSPGCIQNPPSTKKFRTGLAVSHDCNWLINGNKGCSIADTRKSSYGKEFNKIGGGWIAMERTRSFIKVWYWPRNIARSALPEDVRTGAKSINTDKWGRPFALFTHNSEDCNFGEKFGAHNILINLTFCGDWAGDQGVYKAAGCPGTCVDHVNSNPSAFREAYWEFAWLRMYRRLKPGRDLGHELDESDGDDVDGLDAEGH